MHLAKMLWLLTAAFSHESLSPTGVMLLVMFCYAFKSDHLWNVFIPSAGMWRRQRDEAKTECSERKGEEGYQSETRREKYACTTCLN